ncbi:MAG: hypothetical protein Q9207_006219 [Kuettlingeria erythrocarpa]
MSSPPPLPLVHPSLSRSPSALLGLPRELRDIIYHYYVDEAEGYRYDLESGKLRASDKRPIDLALMYTCSTIAKEMHHLALGSNIIHFFTSESPSETERSKAARFEISFDRIQYGRSCALTYLHDVPMLRQYRTADIDAKLVIKYPQFEPLLGLPYDIDSYWKRQTFNARVGTGGMGSTWGEADSMFRAFQRYMLEVLCQDSLFLEALVGSCDEQIALTEAYNQLNHRQDALFVRGELLLSGPEAWIIPSEDELAQIQTSLGPSLIDLRWSARTGLDLPDSPPSGGEPWDIVRWRFSAAAAAILFFNSILQGTCLGIRNVVLHEDRQSVAHPECHVLGLIPFCLQNPRLHIERRVNVWRVLFTIKRFDVREFTNVHEYTERLDMLSGQGEGDKWSSHDRRCTSHIPEVFSRWITEARALSANGMPVHSFSLVLDGDPAPDQGSAVFEIVKEDAARQVAQAQWYTDPDHSPSPSLLVMKGAGFYVSEVFPRAIDDIVRGRSCISCNFPVGDLFDPEWMLERYSSLSHNERYRYPGMNWRQKWFFERYRNPIRLSPPLPALLADIALEDLIPKDQRPAA